MKLRTNNLLVSSVFSSYMLLSACGGGGGGGDSGGGGPEDVNISGQVSGLSDGSVSLRNRDSSPIVVANDGSFNFNSTTSEGYDIQIARNPIEQLCRVENGSASSSNGDVDDIRVICESVSVAAACSGDVDSDEDTLSDCQELNRFGTNPWLADTDGDSYPDAEEAAIYDPVNNAFRFNPRIADMAIIAIDLTSLPQVELNFTESSGSSRSIGTSHDQTQTSGISRDWGGEENRQVEIGHTVSISSTNTVGVEVEASLTGTGVTGSYESSLTVGYEGSVTSSKGSSVNWNQSQSSENSATYTESLDISETTGTSYEDGNMLITAKVRNAGHIAYDLENLTLSAVLFDPRRPFDILPIGNLTYSNGSFPTTSIITGSESAPLNFSTSLSLQKAQQLLRDSKNIVITASTYRLLDADDRSILLNDEDVAARTATITVDYGIHSAREDKYRVAVNSGNGRKSINAADALNEVLGLSVSEGSGQWIYGNDASSSTTPSGLLSVNGFTMDSSTNQYWLVAHNHNNSNGAGERTTDLLHILRDDYNLSDIELRAGDHLTLVYVGDSDRDGLSDRLERDFGTNPDLADTDTDTLIDSQEIYGWLSNLDVPPCDVGDQFRVYSNPLLADSDGDGIDDAVEKSNCENPNFNFVAEAGGQQIMNRGDQVTLRGSIRGIASGNAIYNWRLLNGPDVLVNGMATRELEGREPTFTAPNEVSSLVFALDVTIDGETQSDTVAVQVMKNRLTAVFVGNNESSGAPDGTRNNPYSSIGEALTFLAAGEDLYVMTQSVPYMPTNTLQIPDGSSLFGGYDSNWVRDIDGNRTPIVLNTSLDRAPAIDIPAASSEMHVSGFAVNVNGTSDGSNDLMAMRVSNSTQQVGPVYITDNTLQTGDLSQTRVAAPGNNYALFAKGLSALFVQNNVLNAGRSGAGATGARGTNGRDGDDGGRTNGSGNRRTGGTGTAGGNGGTGGDWGRGPAGRGGSGTRGGPNSTGGTGRGGAGGCKNATTAGGSGGAGGTGAPGAAAGTFNHTVIDGYVSVIGGTGGRGGHGKGGGGGAGGGGCGLAGGGVGGGGGEGGEGSYGGAGGKGGGASIAIWLSDVTTVDIRGNSINSSNGGNAGNGGNPGTRGLGGDGASGGAAGEVCYPFCDRGGAGSAGGDGGNGGTGGYGGGGTGGPSFGIYVGENIAPVLNANNITAGNGGNGGNWGNSGNGGHSYAVYDADTSDGRNPLVAGSNVLNAGTPGVSGTNYGSGSVRGANGSSGAKNF